MQANDARTLEAIPRGKRKIQAHEFSARVSERVRHCWRVSGQMMLAHEASTLEAIPQGEQTMLAHEE